MTLSRALALLDSHAVTDGGSVRVDWMRVWTEYCATERTEDVADEVWAGVGEAWLAKLAATFARTKCVARVPGFLVLSREASVDRAPLVRFAVHARGVVLRDLAGIARDPGFALPLLVIEDKAEYYDYVSQLYPDSGEFGLSAGMFVNAGYPHIVVLGSERTEQDHTLAHELTHALVHHLPLPVWLNEGIAVTMEHQIFGVPFGLTPEDTNEHRDFWNEDSVQEFWSGAAFFRADEGQRLAYQMAELCVKTLAGDARAFREFANSAHMDDGGEAAAHEVFGRSVGELFNGFLGAGDFTPRPEAWSEPTE
jgi:hypothetical protein